MHAEDPGDSENDARPTRVPEHNPEPDPPRSTAYINRVAHVALETDND